MVLQEFDGMIHYSDHMSIGDICTFLIKFILSLFYVKMLLYFQHTLENK